MVHGGQNENLNPDTESIDPRRWDTEKGCAGAPITPFTKWHIETLLKIDGSKNKSLSFKIIKKVNKRLSNII